MRRARAIGLTALICLTALGRTAPAQGSAVSPVTLAPPSATLDEEFTRISSVRELGDGRVLVTDAGDNRLVIADLRRGTVTALGAVGSGPGEYRAASRLVALPGDSTLLVDFENRRWLILALDRIVTTLPASDSSILAAGMNVVGHDARGRTVSVRTFGRAPAGAARQHSVLRVLAVDRRTARVDTLAGMRGPEFVVRVEGPPERQTVNATQVMLSVPEQAIAFSDGWVAVARQDPYRVDWYPPRAPMIPGAPLPASRTPVSATEREAWRARTERQNGRAFPAPLESLAWASEIAPFRSDALQATPDGSLLIAKELWSGSRGTEYDLVDRRGRLTRRILLPENERVVGFGRGAVYVVSTDTDGIERLRRHPWP